MEFITLIAAFFLAHSFMLPSSAADHLTMQTFSHLYHGNSAVQQAQLSLPLLPRKLKLQEEADVKSSTDKDIVQHKKLLESSSGYKEGGDEENKEKHATRKGTWREWVEEGPHKSEYFTMDYAWVRRRRPIHNKNIPFGP